MMAARREVQDENVLACSGDWSTETESSPSVACLLPFQLWCIRVRSFHQFYRVPISNGQICSPYRFADLSDFLSCKMYLNSTQVLSQVL